MNRGRYEKGIASLEKSLQLQPSPEVYFSLGLSYKMVGKNKEAVESLKKYLELASPAERERIKLVRKILSSIEE